MSGSSGSVVSALSTADSRGSTCGGSPDGGPSAQIVYCAASGSSSSAGRHAASTNTCRAPEVRSTWASGSPRKWVFSNAPMAPRLATAPSANKNSGLFSMRIAIGSPGDTPAWRNTQVHRLTISLYCPNETVSCSKRRNVRPAKRSACSRARVPKVSRPSGPQRRTARPRRKRTGSSRKSSQSSRQFMSLALTVLGELAATGGGPPYDVRGAWCCPERDPRLEGHG